MLDAIFLAAFPSCQTQTLFLAIPTSPQSQVACKATKSRQKNTPSGDSTWLCPDCCEYCGWCWQTGCEDNWRIHSRARPRDSQRGDRGLLGSVSVCLSVLSICPFIWITFQWLHSPSSTLHPTVGFSSRWLHWNLLFSTDIKFNFLMWSAGKKKGTQQLLPWDGRAINVICCHYSRQIPLSLFFLSHFTLSPFLLNIFLPSLRRFLSSDAAGRHSDGHGAAVQPSVGSHRHDRQLQTGSWGVTGQRWPSLSLKWQSQTFLTELFSSNEHN